jgi:hypothetical protein
MTWKPELYPDNWGELAEACKAQAEWKCEKCGVTHGSVRIGGKSGKPYKVRLAAAHLDHDPENPTPRLMALCEQCHLQYDIPLHVKNCKITKPLKRYTAQLQAGQLELFW